MTEASLAPGRRPMPLGTKITIGLVAGIAVGIFLGEWSSPASIAGKIYVSLLQMTVLPYVTVSLITRIGALTLDAAKRIAGRAGLVLLAFWGVSLLLVLILPLSLPRWSAGSFFNDSMVKAAPPLDFIDLYLPTNPFHSLANNIVPATVLFSILMGVALISIPKKNVLLDPLKVVNDALGEISGLVMRLSPIGTFALAAGAAGTLSPDELTRLMGYVGTYTFSILLLSLIVLPAMVAAVTPYRVLEFLRGCKSSIIMAFATSKLFAVLPMIIENSKDLLVSRGVPEEEAQTTADMLVPLAFPFPNAGRVMGLLFIPFAAWYSGHSLEVADYPMLLSVGFLAFFGSPVAAIPFLLDLFRLPMDLFPLFLVSGIWCARLGDVLGAVHLIAFAVITSAWHRGLMVLRPRRVLTVLVLCGATTGAAMLLNHLVVKEAISGQDKPLRLAARLDLFKQLVEITVADRPTPNPEPLLPGENHLARILRTGVLRVGFVPHNPPFSHENAAGKVVGLDIDLVQRLAADLKVSLELIPIPRGEIGAGFRDDCFDLAVGAIPSSIRNMGDFTESRTYLELHAALVVKDYRTKEFKTLEDIVNAVPMRIGIVERGLMVRADRDRIPGLELVRIPSEKDFFESEAESLDALLTTAESGSIYCMIHPEYSAVIPQGVMARVPLVLAVQRSEELERLVNTWVGVMSENGTIDELREYWILGLSLEKRIPRWSVIRNVFGWVD